METVVTAAGVSQEDLLRSKERSARGRVIRLCRGVRTLLRNVLPGPLKARGSEADFSRL